MLCVASVAACWLRLALSIKRLIENITLLNEPLLPLIASFKTTSASTDILRASGKNCESKTLYSLRHTYATLELLRASTDIHTLAKQMGNSAAVIERHYSKLTATMAAERLA
jgi:integrase